MEVVIMESTHPAQPLTMPLLSAPGVMFRWHHGTILSPFMDKDGWYGQTPPALTYWAEGKTRPFLSWRIPIWPGKHWRGYLGWKVYGIIDHYVANWLHPKYLGGTAMFFSLRSSLIDAGVAQA